MLLSIMVVLLIVGAVLYILRCVPIDETIKQIAYVVIVVGFVIWLLQLFLGQAGDVRLLTR